MLDNLHLAIAVAIAKDSFNIRTVLFAPETKLLSQVGRRDLSTVREAGFTVIRPGFTKIWVDKPGPGMKQAHLLLAAKVDWKNYLATLGLNGSRASAQPLSVPPSPIPLLRNKLSLHGVTGLPSGKWTVTYNEYAIANKDRLRRMKPQIAAAPVGEARMKLIRTCYDWMSELDISKA